MTQSRLRWLLLAVALVAAPALVVTQSNPTSEPLLQQSSFEYVGQFTLPQDFHFNNGQRWAMLGSAYNPINNSLFVTTYHGQADTAGSGIAEISVPDFQHGQTQSVYVQPSVDPTEGT